MLFGPILDVAEATVGVVDEHSVGVELFLQAAWQRSECMCGELRLEACLERLVRHALHDAVVLPLQVIEVGSGVRHVGAEN